MTQLWSRTRRGLDEKPEDRFPDNSSWNKKALEVDSYRCLTCGWFVRSKDGERFAQSHSRCHGHIVQFVLAGLLP